ncbi:MAG: hypothetical protein ABI680_07455 [Chthoniobacteraceae bacterium]
MKIRWNGPQSDLSLYEGTGGWPMGDNTESLGCASATGGLQIRDVHVDSREVK